MRGTLRAQYGFALSSCILTTTRVSRSRSKCVRKPTSRAVDTGGGDSMTTRTFTIQLPTDGNGLVGRQCTKNDCNKYFKVKPGTGLSKPTQAFCPYCGHADDPSDFLTHEQKEYMLSVVGNQVMAEAAQQLKKHEFNIPARGAFGIGFSLKISPRQNRSGTGGARN